MNMNNYGKASKERLETVDKRFREVMPIVLEAIDHTIVCGHRNEIDQNKAFSDGKSKLKYPNSKHNKLPSKAIDVAVYRNGKVRWPITPITANKKFLTNQEIQDICSHYFMLGVIQGVWSGTEQPGKLRFGADWDSDKNFINQTFFDLPHIEIVD